MGSPESIVTVTATTTTTTSTVIKTKQYNKRKPKELIKKSNHGRGQGKRRGKLSRSRTSTPQPMDPSPSQQKEISDEENNNGLSHDNLSTMLFEYFSPKARASSPPAKTRHPHSRMSISEMNRRANQILEYISSIQVEMASSSKKIHAGHTTIEEEEEEEDDNDSLSSASTIPLNHSLSEEMDRENKSSMEMMDMLTRKLIKFQKRFGSRHRNLYEETLLEGEGRITRSRENTTTSATTSTTTVYRNMMAH